MLALASGLHDQGVCEAAQPSSAEPVLSRELRISPLPGDVARVSIEQGRDGTYWYVVTRHGAAPERMDPEAFAALLAPPQDSSGLLYRFLNITSPIGFLWVLMGLLGQVFFTGRMLLQWIVSEREKRSVVPVGFWWMSVIGATMLVLYFIWRKDVVGVLGQSTGWIIYVRNLWLIYRERQADAAAGKASPPSPQTA